MLESTLLYIKQGLNTHLRAFSPIIIIEDHIYRLLFTHSNNLKDNPDSYDIFDYKNTPELSNGGSTTWDFAIPISNNHFICCTETYRLFPVNAKTGTFKDEICYTPGLAICGCKFKKAIMSEECMKIIKSNGGII